MNRLGFVAALVVAQALGGALAVDAAPLTPSLDQQIKSAPLLASARCYGRFIAWRDELSSAMLEIGAPPSPDAPARFNRVETSFAALALRDRRLTLRLQPTFKEADFPIDIRDAFRIGLKEAGERFTTGAYRTERTGILTSSSQTAIARMSAVENQSDAAFDDIGQPCDRFAKSLNWVRALEKTNPPVGAKTAAKAISRPEPKANTKAHAKAKAGAKANTKHAKAQVTRAKPAKSGKTD